MDNLEPMSDEEVNKTIQRKTLEIYIFYDRAWCTKKQIKINEHIFYEHGCYKSKEGRSYCRYFEKVDSLRGR